MDVVASPEAGAPSRTPPIAGHAARARPPAGRPNWTTVLLLAPSLILLGVFLGIPLIVIAINSLQPNVLLSFKAPALNNYEYLASHSYYLDVVLRTFLLAIYTTIFALPLGYITAMLLRRMSGRLGNLAMIGLTFPILSGPLVVVLGWMSLLPDGGPLFGPLVDAGLISPPHLLGTDTAVIVSLVQFTLPFAVLTLYTALKEIPENLYEAATNLGAGWLRTFLHVTLPLSLPGVLSTVIITFSLAASSYVAPHYLGGAAELTLTTLIAQFILATYNSPLAAASAVMLLVLMVVVVAVSTKFFGRLIRP
jgi:ABC-type spermidine/putrescine transport system permease subunit I